MISILYLLLHISIGRGGLEDLGIGYCHTEGVGWSNNVTAEDILADDWVIVDTEYNNDTASLVDKEDMDVGVYWPMLVTRPKCVDKITIIVGNTTQVTVSDPADFADTKDKIIVRKKICETELLSIIIVNKRGGFDVDLSSVRLVRRQPDEIFQFNLTIFGILDKGNNFLDERSEIMITQHSTNRISLSWNKYIFKEPRFSACLTSAEVVDNKRSVIPLDISDEEAVLRVDDCVNTSLTVRYRYKDTVFLTRVAKVPAVSDCLVSDSLMIGRKQLLGVLLTIILVILMMVVCFRIIIKKSPSGNAAEVPNNRVDILPDITGQGE